LRQTGSNDPVITATVGSIATEPISRNEPALTPGPNSG
jgi:hypothetical protein